MHTLHVVHRSGHVNKGSVALVILYTCVSWFEFIQC